MNPYEALVTEARSRPFAAIVGWPVEHSRSPALHGYWLAKYGLSGAFLPLAIKPAGLRAALPD